MAIRYYDQALVEKVKAWVKDPNLLILSPSDSTRLFQLRADQTGDKPITLPMIALSRDPDIEIINTNKKSLTYEGTTLSKTEAKAKLLNAIPIKISYQLDIYSRYFEEADEYLRNFVFNFINYPGLHIDIPYNGESITHDSTVLIEQSVSDNSDIPERFISGNFTRLTMKLYIDDAYYFSIPFKENWKVEVEGIEITN